MQEMFDQGMPTIRVIVSLNDSGSSGQSAEALHNYMKGVISTFSSQIKVMDVFRYQLGFSAQVTRQGLNELIQRPEVSRIQVDGISRAHSISIAH